MEFPSGSVQLVDPAHIERNPANPRLIFREDELLALQESISSQGILVPLTVYASNANAGKYVILDGERRWRSALKLGFSLVPVIIQAEPDAITNIMMMFAIHKTRSDWDPLPTAMKLQELEDALATRLKRRPTEHELSAASSLTRGEVRRYRNILALPDRHKDRLLFELQKPRSAQILTVDHVLESTRGAEALSKAGVISNKDETLLADAIIEKFAEKTLSSTVEPRMLARIARAVVRDEVPMKTANRVALRLISDKNYTISEAFRDSVEQVDYGHATAQLISRIYARLEEHLAREYDISPSLMESLSQLEQLIIKVRGHADRII